MSKTARARKPAEIIEGPDPVAMLQEMVDEHGVRGTARKVGVSATVIWQTIHGSCKPYPAVLKGLGLERVRVVRYRRV